MEKEQELYQLQTQAQQAAYNAEMEFQQIYTQKMEGLIEKMRDIAEEVGAEQKYDLILGREWNDIPLKFCHRYHNDCCATIQRYIHESV